MGHRLNLAGVDPQGLQQKPLAVAGHRGVADLHERLIRFGSRGSAWYSSATAALAQPSTSPLLEA